MILIAPVISGKEFQAIGTLFFCMWKFLNPGIIINSFYFTAVFNLERK